VQSAGGETRIPLLDAIIFDVDGTLCDVRSVRHHVERAEGQPRFRPNFDRFHSDSITCPPHASVVNLLNRARAAGFAILVVTGREERWSFVTSQWLTDWSIYYDELIMRPARDGRPDAIVKAEIERSISKRYNARLAVDDRPDIIEVWQRAGIATSRVSSDGKVGPIQWVREESHPRLDWFGASQ
jgi:FMN phosphatase YigB (HAD superfamily)